MRIGDSQTSGRFDIPFSFTSKSKKRTRSTINEDSQPPRKRLKVQRSKWTQFDLIHATSRTDIKMLKKILTESNVNFHFRHGSDENSLPYYMSIQNKYPEIPYTNFAGMPMFKSATVSKEFLSMLIVKDHLDLDARAAPTENSHGTCFTALEYAVNFNKVRHAHLLIQAGADIHSEKLGNHDDSYSLVCMTEDTGMKLLLLSLGVDPKNRGLRRNERKIVQGWLKSLEVAKELMRQIFNIANLEELVCDFTYTRSILEKALNNRYERPYH